MDLLGDLMWVRLSHAFAEPLENLQNLAFLSHLQKRRYSYRSSLPVPEVLRPNQTVGPSVAVDNNGLNGKYTTSGTAKPFLRMVSESSDIFQLLRYIAGGLCATLENAEVCITSRSLDSQPLQQPRRPTANKESSASRMIALAEFLCASISEGDTREEPRRKVSEREVCALRYWQLSLMYGDCQEIGGPSSRSNPAGRAREGHGIPDQRRERAEG